MLCIISVDIRTLIYRISKIHPDQMIEVLVKRKIFLIDIKSGVVSSEGETESEFNYIPELHNEATSGFAIAMASGVVNNFSSNLVNPLADNSGEFWGSPSNLTERRSHKDEKPNGTGDSCGSLKKKESRYKVLGPGCEENCRYKCHTKINREQRQVLFDQFWSLQSRTWQWDYISRLMVCEHREGNGTGTSNRKARSVRQYMLPVERNYIKVCRSMLTGTLGNIKISQCTYKHRIYT